MADDLQISLWGTVGAIVMSGIALIRAFWRDGRGATTELEHRLTVVEVAVAAVEPQRIVELQVSIERLHGDIRTLEARLGGLSDLVEKTDSIVDRLEEFHMQRGGGGK